MTETLEQKMQRVMEHFGHLVVATYEDLAIGEVVDMALDCRLGTAESDVRDFKLVVIAKTSRKEADEHARYIGEVPCRNLEIPNYYRVIAE